jgi:hypothetical protein
MLYLAFYLGRALTRTLTLNCISSMVSFTLTSH